jgi:hypothetical protein
MEVYIVSKVVVNGDWMIFKGEDEEYQILASKESLET